MATQASQAAKPGSGGPPDPLPRRFGRYLLFDRIGRGGMADIYLALETTELGAHKRIVVKQILRELSLKEKFARMLIDEAKLVAELRHANIAQVTDLGRADERLFIAMEYVEGFDLNQLLRRLSRRKIPLPAQFGIFIVREILAALDFAHRAKGDSGEPLGIVHRDVSPSNVLISFEGEVKLCDFGIAKAYGSAEPAADDAPAPDAGRERSQVIGKAAYMAPEQARAEDTGAAADVFVAGIILWELCAGRRLYKGSEEQMLRLARAAEIPPLPPRGLPDLPALQSILDRALALDPTDRFDGAAPMLRALDEYAMANKLFVSQIKFGAFLSEHFAHEVVRLRREREIAARALDVGPPVEIEPVPQAPGDTLDEPDERAPEADAPATDTAEGDASDAAEGGAPEADAPGVDAPGADAAGADAAGADSAGTEAAGTEAAGAEADDPPVADPPEADPPDGREVEAPETEPEDTLDEPEGEDTLDEPDEAPRAAGAKTGVLAPPERDQLHSVDTARLSAVDADSLPPRGVRVPLWVLASAGLMLAVIAAAIYALLG